MRDPWKRLRPRRRLWLRALATNLTLLLAGAVTIGAFAAWAKGLRATDAARRPLPIEANEQIAALDRRLQEARGKLDVTRLQLERAAEILRYSARYRIPADLAGTIYDVAVAEGIHPSLGFQLVKVESGFKPRARGPRGAIGYAQVRLATAKIYDPDITTAALDRTEPNLRIGFRFLNDLLERFDGDLEVALAAYNRGPTLVDSIVTAGGDPSNGYAGAVMGGMEPKARPSRPPRRSGEG